MKVLIGTPINEVKDYAMERWLKNVAELRLVFPADFLMVDNSPGPDYVEKVKGYCKKYGITNYKIEHFEINQWQPPDEKIGRSREIIRQYILARDYDAWFSWESDQIIPFDTLGKLIKIMEAENYTMIHPNSWSRNTPDEPVAELGCCLIKRWALEKCGFTLEYSDVPNNWTGNDIRFKKRILREGGNFIQIYGIIHPIYHLDDPKKKK